MAHEQTRSFPLKIDIKEKTRLKIPVINAKKSLFRMDDFFRREITPFARISIGSTLETEENKIEWLERWKYIDNGVYNRAVKIKWNMISNIPVNNWTDLQRRVKHLLAARIELDTMLDWIAEEAHQGHLNLVRLPENSITEPSGSVFDFWSWDQEICRNGSQACLFNDDQCWKSEVNSLMVSAIHSVLNTGSDRELIQIKKQLTEIMREIYDLIICTCPWEGVINGGPMLPNQEIQVSIREDNTVINCSFEFSILGGRARDIRWLKDLKFPELSNTAQIWIQHGANRRNTN